MSQFSHREIGL